VRRRWASGSRLPVGAEEIEGESERSLVVSGAVPNDPCRVNLTELARKHHAFVSSDNPFQRRARVLQALWREEQGTANR